MQQSPQYTATQPAGGQVAGGRQGLNLELLNFLQANTQDVEYLAAVPSSGQQGAQLVLASGRPVLYMGGFGGWDEVVNAQDLQAMVANRELRYVLYADAQGEIGAWLQAACEAVPGFDNLASNGPGVQATTLYECR